MPAAPSLAEVLGVSTLPMATHLAADEQHELAELVRAARERQQRHLAEAFDAALSHVPALLRGPVRRIFAT